MADPRADLACSDFASQAEAQDALDSLPSGSGRLDPDRDGIACESDFGNPEPEPAPKAAPYYKNCDAVRAAGAAPIHAGDPGWQQKFDADKDGTGCE